MSYDSLVLRAHFYTMVQSIEMQATKLLVRSLHRFRAGQWSGQSVCIHIRMPLDNRPTGLYGTRATTIDG